MAENSRVEDLRKRYHENPRRFFAPLANEYRKAGFLDRALLLCQKHVPEQPDNMNGLVVFGQVLFESGNTAAAKEPFERALTVDPENLIALRHLGDIARIGGDVATAKQWYERVLEFDRRNDEVLDLLQQMGFEDLPAEPTTARPSTTAAGLVSVASTVSVSSASDIGMIDLDAPVAPPPPAATPTGPGRTVVINAQALADRDRSEAATAGAVTQPVEAVRPNKRASLLDIDFDFSETGADAQAAATPDAPVMGAEAAEYGLEVESIGDVPPMGLDATLADAAPLGLEPTAAEAEPAPAPELPAGDFELAEFSTEVAPLAGLEATEFTTEEVSALADLDNDTASASISAVAALDGLDRVDVEPGTVEPLSGLSDLPLLDDEDPVSATPFEAPSARPRPRMTKADMSSLPLIADFGLEDDEPAMGTPTPIITPAVRAEPPSLELPSVASASEPPLRPSKATPAFVTETMAALYLKQGHVGDAVAVYRQLVAQSPNDSGLRAKLVELERMQQAEPLPATAAQADVEMPEFEEPMDVAEPEPAAANAAMDDVSFGDIGLKAEGAPTPVLTPAVPVGPSAREFFGGFARRAAVAAAVMAVAVAADGAEAHAEPDTAISASVSSWPLDTLFGAAHEVRDLHAAEVLASIGTFEGPDGGSGLDALFAEKAQPARRSVPRASEMLKFDQFFQAPGTAAPPAPEPPPSDASGEPGEDDLDQFHGWLQGLKK